MKLQRQSLSELNDVVSPADVSLWPTTLGWGLVLLASLIAAGIFAVHLLRRHRALRYRREALEELRALRTAGEWRALPALLKRVALAVYPRSVVASLSGDEWVQFLDSHGGDGAFAREHTGELAALAYGALPTNLDGLSRTAERWIVAQPPALEEVAP